MQFLKVKTPKLRPPQINIYKVLDVHLPKLKNGDVLFITSKILGLHQGRTKKIDAGKNKHTLILQEADYYIPKHTVVGADIVLTIKDHTLIPSAGIDESNGDGYYIYWPKNSSLLAQQITNYLKKKFKLKKLAVVVTDSHTTPLRWGTLGISIGFWGLEPNFDYRGKKDIFSRKLKYTQSNVVDALSAMAVLLMGEGNEQTPMVIGRDIKFIKFTSRNTYDKFIIDPEKDLYFPILKSFKKI